MKLIIIAALLASCVDSQPDAHTEVLEECGAPPDRPGIVIGANGNTLTIERAVWLGLDAWMHDMQGWTECVEWK